MGYSRFKQKKFRLSVSFHAQVVSATFPTSCSRAGRPRCNFRQDKCSISFGLLQSNVTGVTEIPPIIARRPKGRRGDPEPGVPAQHPWIASPIARDDERPETLDLGDDVGGLRRLGLRRLPSRQRRRSGLGARMCLQARRVFRLDRSWRRCHSRASGNLGIVSP